MHIRRLLPAIGGMVYLRNRIWLYIRNMEGVCILCLPFLEDLHPCSCPYRWLLYASATVVGSTCSFIVSRTILSRFVKRLMEHDKRFTALALTLKYDGLKLLCMIRLCPLPYSICNGAVSTFPTVHPLMYGLATAIVSPKLLVPAFIGSRLRVLSEKDEQMSALSKAVNITSIIITVGIGIFTGWYIYRRWIHPVSPLASLLGDFTVTPHKSHSKCSMPCFHLPMLKMLSLSIEPLLAPKSSKLKSARTSANPITPPTVPTVLFQTTQRPMAALRLLPATKRRISVSMTM